MRRLCIAVLLVLILLSGGALAVASTKITAELADFRFLIDGSGQVVDQPPLVYAGRSYLPVRSLATMLGYDVDYIDATETIVLNRKLERPAETGNTSWVHSGANISVTADLAGFRFVVNGAEQIVDQSPLVYAGRSYLPVRALATLLGYDVDYIETTRTIVLDSTQRSDLPNDPPTDVLPKVPSLTEVPVRFDLREWAALTPVNKQGSLGSCWAVALTDSLESKIMIEGEERLELSIYNMIVQTSNAYANSFDREHGGGGMAEIGLAYLTGWKGPVLEQVDPYYDNGDEYRLTTNVRPVKLVQGVILFPNRKHALDNDLYKQHLIEHGAIYIAMWKGTPSTYDKFYNQETFAWYYPHDHLTPEGNGHAVTIVGWDDDFPREYFNPENLPPGNGAFIVRNTKGEEWGSLTPGHDMGGYFFMSYYDTKLGQTMYGYPNETGAVGFARVDDVGTYDYIYQHDTLGYNDRYHPYANEVSMRNDFVVGLGQNERLSAVSFYTLEEDVRYEVWLYRNVQGADSYGTRTKVSSGSVEVPGYYTVDLDSEVELNLREKIAVEVKLISNKHVSFAMDSASGYSSTNSEYKPNTSFIYLKGKWVDLHSKTEKGKACIKVFTRDKGPDEKYMISPQTMQAELDIFIRNLTEKQAEFLHGFSLAQQKVVDSVYEEIKNPLSIREFDLALKRILSMASDGHASVNIQNAMALNRGGIDIEFEWLSDGLYVMSNIEPLKTGDKVIMVGDLTTEQLMKTMRKTFATENDYYVKYSTNRLLRVESYLREYGVVNLNNTVDMLIERGDQRFITQVPINPEYRAGQAASRTYYECRIEKENDLGYFRFDYWPNDQGGERAFYLELENAVHDFFHDVRVNGINNIAIDVRQNGGGFVPIQYLFGEYFVEGGLPWRRPNITMRDPSDFFRGKVYYLQGYGSFSLSVNAAMMFIDASDIIIFGEESGQRPNFNHGTSFNDLVYLDGSYRLGATTPPLRSFQKEGDDTIHPDILVTRRFEDILVGRDTQLERLREITRGGETWIYAEEAVNLSSMPDSWRLTEGPSNTYDPSTQTFSLNTALASIEEIYFIDTKTHNERVPLTLEGDKLTLLADIRPGVTYDLVFECQSGLTIVFPTTVFTPGENEDPIPPAEQALSPSHISNFSYSSRFGYFVLTFIADITSYSSKGVQVLDSTGKSVVVSVSIANDYRNVLIVSTGAVLARNNIGSLTLSANAVTLSNGITNATPITLRHPSYN